MAGMSAILTPAHLDQAALESTTALDAGIALDWSVQAHGVDWTCQGMAEHIADCQISYALLVTSRSVDRYPPLETRLDQRVGPGEIVSALRASATLLSAVITATPADIVVWHPAGMADLSAVAGMGIIEALVHTWDIATALNLPYSPDAELCAATVARMFPEVRTTADPWLDLLWATGRHEALARPRRTDWQWTNDLSV